MISLRFMLKSVNNGKTPQQNKVLEHTGGKKPVLFSHLLHLFTEVKRCSLSIVLFCFSCIVTEG